MIARRRPSKRDGSMGWELVGVVPDRGLPRDERDLILAKNPPRNRTSPEPLVTGRS